MLWLLALYALTSALSLAAFLALVIALPPSYFSADRQLWVDRHPLVRWLGIIGKNILGLAIVFLGLVLSLPGIPGQGLLTIAIGAMLLDFPGKHRLLLAALRRPAVLDNLNRLRRLFGRSPLLLP